MPFNVLLDTSMLMIAVQKRVDIFGQMEAILQGRIKFTIPRAVLAELSTIGQQKSQRGRLARAAVGLAEECTPWQGRRAAGESTDDYLVRAARETGGIVATGDSELRRKLRNANMPVIYVRKDLRLAIEGIEPTYR